MPDSRTCSECGIQISPSKLGELCPECRTKGTSDGDALTINTEDKASRIQESLESVYSDSQAATVVGTDLNTESGFGDRIRYFGDYEILEEIARGGMGVVYKARQVSLNRIVAVKMILSGQLAGEASVKRFQVEAEAAANLDHPNIVSIHEVGEHESLHYFSMDYVDGIDLNRWIKVNGPMESDSAAHLLRQIADAIHYANQRGTLHRDLKPQNILIDHQGIPRITDFGLARNAEADSDITRTGVALGTPAYMPPEQAKGELACVGPHSEVYGLGGILYYILTGQAPFQGETPLDIMAQVLTDSPIPPRKHNAIAQDLETICLKCLEKNGEQRYATAQELGEELDRFSAKEPILARPATALRRAWTWTQKHPWFIAGILATTNLATALAAYGIWSWHERTTGDILLSDRTNSWDVWALGFFFVAGLPLSLISLFFSGLAFKHRFSQSRYATSRWATLFRDGYGVLSMCVFLYGVFTLFGFVRCFVYRVDPEIGFGFELLILLALPLVIGMMWQAGVGVWEALGSHHSSRFGQMVDQRIQRWVKLREHSKRWSIGLQALFIMGIFAAMFVSFFWFILCMNRLIPPTISGDELPNPLVGISVFIGPIGGVLLFVYRFAKSDNPRMLSWILCGIMAVLWLIGVSTAPPPAAPHMWGGWDAPQQALSGLLGFTVGCQTLLSLTANVTSRRKLTARLFALIGLGVAIAATGSFYGNLFPRWFASTFVGACASLCFMVPAITRRAIFRSLAITDTDWDSPGMTLRKAFADLFHWLRRHKIRFALGAGIATGLVFTIYLVENWRGESAWRQLEKELRNKGLPLDWNEVASQDDPNEDSFWEVPQVQEWFIRADNGPQTELPITLPSTHFSAIELIRWSKGEPPDTNPSIREFESFGAFMKNFELAPSFMKTMGHASSLSGNRIRGDSLSPLHTPRLDFTAIRLASQALAQQSTTFVIQKRFEESLKCKMIIGRLADVSEEPIPSLVGSMIRIAIQGLNISHIRAELKEGLWPDEHLQKLNAITEILSPLSSLQRGLAAEIVASANSFDGIADLSPLSRFRLLLGRNHFAPDRRLALTSWTDAFGPISLLSPRGLILQKKTRHVRFVYQARNCISENGLTADVGALLRYKNDLKKAIDHDRINNIITAFDIPDYQRPIAAAIQIQTDVSLLRVAIGLEQFQLKYQTYPDNLEALTPDYLVTLPVDTVTGSPLRFSLVDSQSYILYSTGWDRDDDQGLVPLQRNLRDPFGVDGDWVF